MKQISNIHTHSQFCDGADTPSEIAKTAIEMGFTDIGFSSHSPRMSPFGFEGLENEQEYRQAIALLKTQMEGRIRVYCGIEHDAGSVIDASLYDYVIGSVHYCVVQGDEVAVDYNTQICKEAIQQYFGGNGLKLAEAYYQTIVESVRRNRPDVVGHFDIVTKYNKDNVLFDEGSKQYQSFALEALDEVISETQRYGGVIEVNTGAVARGVKELPYPAPFLLQHAAKRGANMVITTDCHNKNLLGASFEQSVELMRSAGFSSMAVWENGAFAQRALE